MGKKRRHKKLNLKEIHVDESVAKKTKNDDLKVPTEPSLNIESAVPESQKNHENINQKQEILDQEKLHENSIDSSSSHKSFYVPVHRKEEIQVARMKLPIAGEEQMIMESIAENNFVILCGETGSGKTTQVPQFLYEAGYTRKGMIGITEPRRVAAIAMSKRVGEELNMSPEEISFQIRFEGNVTEKTKMKFMTDGVLLKEVQNDFLLNRYSVIIIDEAHERSVYTDILIGLLSRIVPLRKKRGCPLKLIIMSATLRIEDFTENKRLFKETPPVIKVEARQFPVAMHFCKKTPDDYLTEAFKKICKIHRKLPEGGILVFVTGQQEVNVLCKKLKQTFTEYSPKPANKSIGDENEETDKKLGRILKKKKSKSISLDSYSAQPLQDDTEMDILEDLDSDGDDDEDVIVSDNLTKKPVHVLPLYSLLSSANQAKVFKPVPEGTRLIVVSTNVAETSLTIPNIKYVVDTGKVKERFYDKVTGVSTFQVVWTSKASADQRSGRAGRVGPGHCYRLYSSAIFNDEFSLYSLPEICRKPVEDLVIQMKAMNIDKVINFPFPSPPDKTSLFSAEQILMKLGALTSTRNFIDKIKMKDLMRCETSGRITELGRVMSVFPIGSRYSKMLALGNQHNLLPYLLVIISAMSVQEVLIPLHTFQKIGNEVQVQKIAGIRKLWAGSNHSLQLGDVSVLLKAIGTCEYAGFTSQWCDDHGLRYKALAEIRKLRLQLTNTLNLILPELNLSVDPKMLPPTDDQMKLLAQIVLSGHPDHVARIIPRDELSEDEKKTLKNAYQCSEMQDPVFIHPESILFRELPEFLVYQEIIETKKMYMKGITAVKSEWLLKFVPNLCTTTKIDSVPRYDEESDCLLQPVNVTFGRRSWELPPSEVKMPSELNTIKWFARFLLEGKVIEVFNRFKLHYLSSPAIIIRIQNNLHQRVELLLKALVKGNIDCRSKLINIWKENRDFLKEEMKLWVSDTFHDLVDENWPPIEDL